VGRSGGSAIALEEIACEADEILEPHRLESQLRTELAKLVGNLVLEEVIAGHDGHRRCAQFSLRAQPPQKTKAVNERHSKIQNDRVGTAFFGKAEAVLRVDRCANLIALQPQHAGKRLRDAFIVVDDQNF